MERVVSCTWGPEGELHAGHPAARIKVDVHVEAQGL